MAPPPPPQKGPNIGLFIGIGCFVLFLIGGIASGVAVFWLRRTSSSAYTPPPTSTATSKSGNRGQPEEIDDDDDADDTESPHSPSTGSLQGEIRDLRDFSSKFGKSRHFVGEIHNTGRLPMGYPAAKVTFYDASNTALVTSRCTTLMRVLPPGEKVPCTFLLLKIDSWATYKAEVTATKSLFRGKIAEFGITETKFTPKHGYSPHEVSGKITNKSAFRAKSVWALVSLYDADGKIVGAEQTLVAGKDLDAGASGRFSANIYNVAATPATYRVQAIGYSE